MLPEPEEGALFGVQADACSTRRSSNSPSQGTSARLFGRCARGLPQTPAEPRLTDANVAADGGDGVAEDLGHFLDVEAAEILQLEGFRLAQVNSLEILERIVQATRSEAFSSE